jgi:ABC-type glycerol-3-phosphate transport system substrate-binding protein
MLIDYIGFQAMRSPLPFDMGVMPLPVGAQASTEFDVKAFYITGGSDAPQLCWEWLTFLSGRPEVVQLLPARRSVAASQQWQEQVDQAALPAYLATLEYADTSLFRLRWWPYWGGYTYPWLDEAFQAVVAGEDAERALGVAQAKIEEFVACQETAWGSADYYDQLKVCARQVDANYPLPDGGQ